MCGTIAADSKCSTPATCSTMLSAVATYWAAVRRWPRAKHWTGEGGSRERGGRRWFGNPTGLTHGSAPAVHDCEKQEKARKADERFAAETAAYEADRGLSLSKLATLNP